MAPFHPGFLMKISNFPEMASLGSHLERQAMSQTTISEEDHPTNITFKFGSIWPCGSCKEDENVKN
jgi:hypothetical protein